jgi:hypothetical protein
MTVPFLNLYRVGTICVRVCCEAKEKIDERSRNGMDGQEMLYATQRIASHRIATHLKVVLIHPVGVFNNNLLPLQLIPFHHGGIVWSEANFVDCMGNVPLLEALHEHVEDGEAFRGRVFARRQVQIAAARRQRHNAVHVAAFPLLIFFEYFFALGNLHVVVDDPTPSLVGAAYVFARITAFAFVARSVATPTRIGVVIGIGSSVLAVTAQLAGRGGRVDQILLVFQRAAQFQLGRIADEFNRPVLVIDPDSVLPHVMLLVQM